VILAGGLGTRLHPLTLEIPKPMVRIAGRPFLEYQVLLLKKNGFKNFVLCVGYKSEVIRDYFGDGSKLGVSLIFSNDGQNQRGPIGALRNASELLDSEFMVTYGDSFQRLDYRGFEDQFHSSGKLGLMAVLENRNKYGKSDIVVKDGLVKVYDKVHQSPEMLWINYGAFILRKEALELVSPFEEASEEQFFRELINREELGAYFTYDRFFEIGTIYSLREFEDYVAKNPTIVQD